jgi:hypothetical protein
MLSFTSATMLMTYLRCSERDGRPISISSVPPDFARNTAVANANSAAFSEFF